MNSYCLPIIKTSKHDVMRAIESRQAAYRYFEVWLDYVEDFDPTFLDELQDAVGDALIVLFRRQNLETINMPLERRLEIIDKLNDSDVLLDLDTSQKDELEYIAQQNLKIRLITSYHNYEQTPDDAELVQIVDGMKRYNPAIYKISTLCGDEKDAVRLLGLQLQLSDQKLDHIVLGMGKASMATRILGPLWGNVMNFAPGDAKSQSAPGQLTLDQQQAIFQLLDPHF